MFDAKPILANLPTLPGVYRMLDSNGDVLYVGKAIDLKRRVSQYFQKSDLSPRIALMVKQIAAIETTVVRNEVEALVLENNLIKSLAPKYNILFRDDKSYPYLQFSPHAYPQLSLYRGALQQGRYFGPYPNGQAVREAIHILQRVFRLRTCEDTVFHHRSRPCLLYQIKRCSGPCVDAISQAQYQQDVQRAVAFLQGRTHDVLSSLEKDMQAASAAWEFEQAAALRDQIQALARLQDTQYVSSTANTTDADVITIAQSHDLVCVNLVMIRGGRHVGDRSLFPENSQQWEPEAILEAFVLQHYGGQPVPPLLICEYSINVSVINLLAQQADKAVRVVQPQQGEMQRWLEMSQKNATLALSQRHLLAQQQGLRLAALSEVSGIEPLQRLECFDISHTQGEATVASCVVYDHGAMQPSQYRRYHIEGIVGGDDYAAMRQVLFRRYEETVAGEAATPDIVLIDGGQGQVNVAKQVLEELGLSHIPIIGVAKGEERRPGCETLILEYAAKSVQLGNNHAALHLIQTIRDEAHRFAITGHRQRRNKMRVQSKLEDIEGIGSRRRQRLLAHFGGLRGVMAASIEDIAKVEGMSRKLAERVYAALHPDAQPSFSSQP